MAKAYWKVLGATKQGYLWIAVRFESSDAFEEVV